MIFYDFEVFDQDWLVVIQDPVHKYEKIIINDEKQLIQFYEKNKNDIWIGYNSNHYDQYIIKGIVCGMNPKEINDFIIEKGNDGWKYSALLRKVPLISYDVMPNPPIGLKTLEGFMGMDIKETDVPFDIDRKLTDEEINETVKYCRHDVEATIAVFLNSIDVFNAKMGIIKNFNLPLSDLSLSEARLVAKVLECKRIDTCDEYQITILPCIRLNKYKFVQQWFEELNTAVRTKIINMGNNPDDEETWRKYYYKSSLTVDVAGVPHTFGFGGLHGAPDKPIHETGLILHVDVNNYYPSFLIAQSYITRASSNNKYEDVYVTRKKLKWKQKHAKTKEEAKSLKKAQLPYKKMLNALSGAMKDKYNSAYDPRNNNIMCINGQLMLLDLIEKLEAVPGFKLIQSNTDGLIIKIPDTDEAFDAVDDICYEWEKRVSTKRCDIKLEFDVIDEIYQKDVNNYLWIEEDGSVTRIGAYVKELNPLSYDLPVVNKALVEYMVHGTPIKDTIMNEDNLIEFQKIVKLSNKYRWVEHEHCDPEVHITGVRVKHEILVYPHTDKYTYKSYRVFASSDRCDGRILKCGGSRGKAEKFGNTPDHCFICNDDVTEMKCPDKLDKQYYIDIAERRLKDYGLC